MVSCGRRPDLRPDAPRRGTIDAPLREMFAVATQAFPPATVVALLADVVEMLETGFGRIVSTSRCSGERLISRTWSWN
jgi:hypothetical protein